LAIAHYVQRVPAHKAWRVAVGLGRDLERGAEAVERASGSRTVDGKSGAGQRCTNWATGLTETIIVHNTNVQ